MLENNIDNKSVWMIVCKKEVDYKELSEQFFGTVEDVYFIDNQFINKFPYKYLTPKVMIRHILKKIDQV